MSEEAGPAAGAAGGGEVPSVGRARRAATRRPPRAAVRAAVRDALADLTPGARVLVALSGGPDSLALLAGTLVVGRERGLLVAAVVVDHGLQAGSAQVAARAGEQARILGCEDVRVARVAVDRGPGSGGPEAAARRARYAELLRQAGVVGAGDGPSPDRPAGDGPRPPAQADRTGGQGPRPPDRAGGDGPPAEVDWASGDGTRPPAQADRAVGDGTRPPAQADRAVGDGEPASDGEPPAGAEPVILLGHTRDDQAETVLLGLARGSGTRSLAGMAARSGPLRRPLLDLPRSVVQAAAAEAADEDPRLVPWLDPHNRDQAFARGRVRVEAMPVLEAALGPGVVDALARSARLARADADALDAWAEQVWAHCRVDAPAEGRAAVEGGSPAAGPGAPRPEGAPDPSVWALHWPLAAVPAASPVLATPVPSLPWAIRTRLVRRFLLATGCPAGALTAEQVERVTALLDGPPRRAEVALPAGRRARREGAALAVRA